MEGSEFVIFLVGFLTAWLIWLVVLLVGLQVGLLVGWFARLIAASLFGWLDKLNNRNIACEYFKNNNQQHKHNFKRGFPLRNCGNFQF